MNTTAMNRWALALLLAVWAGGARAQLKIAYIDPLSGLMAATGEHGLRELQYNAERINARGGIQGQKIEVVPMDNKLSPQESLVLLNKAIDEGIRKYIAWFRSTFPDPAALLPREQAYNWEPVS